MAIRHEISLSTTEPNNSIGLLKIRQDDEETQTLVVDITENSQPRSFEGLTPFFCAKLGQNDGLGIIEQKVEGVMNPAKGTLEYTMQFQDWQTLGTQIAYFSFRKLNDDLTFTEQFTTRNFNYTIIKSVFSDGLAEVKTDGSTYVWTFEEILRLFNEWKETNQGGFLDWFETIKDTLGEDAAGNLAMKIMEIFGDMGALEDFRDWDESIIEKLKNESSERGFNPKWFGAVMDGITDDSAAFQDCIDTAKSNGGYVRIPQGEMRINSTIQIPTVMRVMGAGSRKTSLLSSAEVDMFQIESNCNEVHFSNLTCKGILGESNSCFRFDDTNAGRSITFSDMTIDTFSYGLKGANLFWYSAIERVRINLCKFGMYFNAQNNIGNMMNHVYFDRCSDTAAVLHDWYGSLVACNFGGIVDAETPQKFLDISLNSIINISGTNFEHILLGADAAAITVRGQSAVTVQNCSIWSHQVLESAESAFFFAVKNGGVLNANTLKRRSNSSKLKMAKVFDYAALRGDLSGGEIVLDEGILKQSSVTVMSSRKHVISSAIDQQSSGRYPLFDNLTFKKGSHLRFAYAKWHWQWWRG